MKKFIYLIAVTAMIASCSSPSNQGNMTAEANKKRVQEFYDQVMNGHNPAMIDSFCMPDFIDHNPDPGKTGKGIEELKASFAEFMAAFPDLKATTDFMLAEGDKVAAHITMTGTNSGPFMGAPATNKQISIEGIDIISIKDGKATDRWGFFDSMKMMQQMGMMPEPGAMPDSSMKK